MTTTRVRQRNPFAKPFPIRAGLLIAFAGAPGSGKTTQWERIRQAHTCPPDGVPLFGGDVRFLVGDDPSVVQHLRRGRTVFADSWQARPDALPDLVLLFGRDLVGTGRLWPPLGVPADRVAAMPLEGHEGVVGQSLWTALASRDVFGPRANGAA